MRALIDDCGIIVTSPEDVLSLKLACVEESLVQKRGYKYELTGSLLRLVSNITMTVMMWHSLPTGKQWIGTVEEWFGLAGSQRFLEIRARDIIDESDYVLRPQSQLIYAVGHQHPFAESPNRWLIVQQVLGLVKRYADFHATPYSCTIWHESKSPGSFPHIQISHADAGGELISLITQDVLDELLSGLSFASEEGLQGTIREFVSCKDSGSDIVKKVEQHARESIIWGPLLLLRGLLAHNILLFALTQRRWRVDYGLDPSSQPRTMLAIPYRAKDVPAETAEFGHPDITILLTCLSYYYGGLSEEQLRTSFELLLQQDDPSSEYALWVNDYGNMSSSVPITLQNLSGVNIRSSEQWATHLVPLFTRNKRAIDPYLSKVVFPKYAKEFPQRILGSSWDIAERKKVHLVTGQWAFHICIGSQIETRMSGFSGTNDAQYLLPTSIAQDDPDHLRQTGTNAKVLAYLLQPENSSYMVAADENGERWTTLKLLKTVVAQKPQIRVLLDVGAQILDLSNLDVVRAWLDCTPATEVAGAIYFGKDDKLMVLARDGTTQPLSSSPLAQQLHLCVAYLDHAHTRGTDIKFPLGFRAAVTLGHKVTKDHLVQGIAKPSSCNL